MRRVMIALCAVVLFAVPTSRAVAAAPYARTALNTVLPDAKFTNVALSDAIDFIRDVTGANITVDWKSLEALNISKDTQINLSLKQVRMEKLLKLVLNEAAPGNLLTYYVDQNVITITTQAVADQKTIVVVYYVEDLIDQDLPFNTKVDLSTFGQTLSATANSGTAGGSTGASGGSGNNSSIFSGGTSSGQSQQDTATIKSDRAKALIKVIEDTIRPEIWKDNGGTASIEYLNGNLIVSAPQSVQESIGGPVDR